MSLFDGLDKAEAWVDSINTCKELTEFNNYWQGKIASITSALTLGPPGGGDSPFKKLVDKISNPADPSAAVTFCNDMYDWLMAEKAAMEKFAEDVATATTQLGRITDKITNKATTLGCNGGG